MAKKIALTPASINALQKGLLADLLTPGLAIEVLASGKKRWRFRRQVAGRDVVAVLYGQLFPAQIIAAAREWARGLNEKIEAGVDPREALREEKARASMTVARAHELYMVAVREGRASRAKRPNSPRTIKDKFAIYNRDIAPKLAKRSMYEVTEAELIRVVEAKRKIAKVRANRLAAELKVFFGWASSLRGLEIGLEVDPSRRLGDLRFPESPRSDARRRPLRPRHPQNRPQPAMPIRLREKYKRCCGLTEPVFRGPQRMLTCKRHHAGSLTRSRA